MVATPQQRWVFALMGSCGFIWVYALRVNLSVALMAMVNHTAILTHNDHGLSHDNENSSTNLCVTEGEQDDEPRQLLDGPFVWDENVQGIVLASYFYGYIFTQLPGGWLAERYSAKHIFGWCTFVNAIFAILTPVAAKFSYVGLVVARVVMGLTAGTLVPTMHVLIASWAPPNERSKISSTIYTGATVGTMLCLPASGVLAASLGWESVFYVQGAGTIVWFVFWMFLVYDSPEVHPRISRAEQVMIINSIAKLGGAKDTENKMPVPWKKVFSSMAVWAIIVGHTCVNWGWYMLIVKLPTYMRYILHFDISANAWLSALPYLVMWVFSILWAVFLDTLRSKGILATGTVRKISTALCSCSGIFLVLVTYVGCNTTLAVVLLAIATMLVGGMFSGYLGNHIDIAPPFAGTLMGISNTFATIPGIVMPSFIGYMTHGNQTIEAWRSIFYITFGILLFELIFYTIFAKGEQQEWAKTKSTQNDENVRLNDHNRL